MIPATVCDATYVLDAILDNETELTILGHATDMDGYTEIVFALFDLLGLQFAPRLRDIAHLNTGKSLRTLGLSLCGRYRRDSPYARGSPNQSAQVPQSHHPRGHRAV